MAAFTFSSESLYFCSYKKCHSLPGKSEKMHIKAKFQKTEFDKYATSRVSAFSLHHFIYPNSSGNKSVITAVKKLGWIEAATWGVL